MTQTALSKEQKRIEDIGNVQLSNRTFHGEYVTYTALSRDGHTEYTVTLHEGKATGCTCPARVKCVHMCACEFEEVWIAPIAREDEMHEAAQVAPMILGEFAEDLPQHVADDIASGAFDVEPAQLVPGSCNSCGRATKKAYCAECGGVTPVEMGDYAEVA